MARLIWCWCRRLWAWLVRRCEASGGGDPYRRLLPGGPPIERVPSPVEAGETVFMDGHPKLRGTVLGKTRDGAYAEVVLDRGGLLRLQTHRFTRKAGSNE